MSFQDTHDAFEYARKSWDKYGLGVDFDTAWQTYYDNHYDPEHYEDWVDPIWSQEAWDALVIENGGDPNAVEPEIIEFDDELGESVKEAFDLMTASDVVRKMYQKFPEIEFVSESDPVGGNVLLIFELPKGIINKLEQITNWLEQHGVDVSFSGKYLKVSVPEDEMDESLRTKLFKKIGCYSDGSPMEESFEDDYDIDNDEYGTHYDAAHAEEWMDKHPYGYYNNEDDYGLDDDMDWEGYDDLEEDVNNLAYKNARKFYDWVEATDPYDQDITFEKSNGVYTVSQTFDESGTAVLNVFYPDGKVYVNNLSGEGAYDTDRFNSFEEFCDAYQIEINESLAEEVKWVHEKDYSCRDIFKNGIANVLTSNGFGFGKSGKITLPVCGIHNSLIDENGNIKDTLTNTFNSLAINFKSKKKFVKDITPEQRESIKRDVLALNNDAQKFVDVIFNDRKNTIYVLFDGETNHNKGWKQVDESLNEGAMTNGSYSLYTGWVKVPDKDSIPDEYPELEPEYSEWVERSKGCETIDEIDDFLDDVYKLRQQGLLSSGEYGKENLIFKELRNNGFLQELKDKKVKLQNKEMSLESLNESLTYNQARDFFKQNGLDLPKDIFNTILNSNGEKSDMPMDDLEDELTAIFDREGYDVEDSKAVQNTIQAAAEYIRSWREEGAYDYSPEEWFHETMVNYPEDFENLPMKESLDKPLNEEYEEGWEDELARELFLEFDMEVEVDFDDEGNFLYITSLEDEETNEDEDFVEMVSDWCRDNLEDALEFNWNIVNIETRGNDEVIIELDPELNESEDLKADDDKTFLTEDTIDDDRAAELADYLGVDVSEVEEGTYDNSFKADGEEYYVLTYDEAEELAKDQVLQLIDEMGIEGFSKDFQEEILQNYINEEDVDDFIDDEVDYFRNQEEDEDTAEWLENLPSSEKINYMYDTYGPDGFQDWAKDHIDWDAVAEEVVRLDGPENTLATYDGNEIQLDTYYAYRID